MASMNEKLQHAVLSGRGEEMAAAVASQDEFDAFKALVLTGAGAPAVAAPVGTLYLRTDGGTDTTLYVKESGTDTSGWVAK